MGLKSLSAIEFARRLVAGEVFPVGDRYRVKGEVSLRGETLPRPLLLHGFLFEGPVDFSDVEVPGELDFTDCRFMRTLRLTQMHVRGSIRWRRVRVDGMAGEADEDKHRRILHADGLSCEGDVEIEQLACAGGVTLERLQTKGALRISELRTEAHLDLRNGRVEGPAWLQAVKTSGSIDLEGVEVRGGCLLTQSACGVGQNLDIRNARFHDQLTADGLDIGGDWLMFGTIGEAALLVRSTSVRGCFRLDGASFARVQIQQVDLTQRRSRFGQIWASGLSTTMELDFSGIRIGPPPKGHRIALALDGLKANSVGFSRLDNLRESSAVRDPARRLSVIVRGDVSMDGATAGRKVDLSGIIIRGHCTLRNARIGTELLFRSALTHLEEFGRAGMSNDAVSQRRLEEARDQQDASGKAQEVREKGNARPARKLPWRADGPRGSPLRARMCSLDLSGCRIGTEADLTGLVLRDADPFRARLEAPDLEVQGRLRLSARDPENREASIDCPGRAQLTGAKLGRLEVSGRSFRNPKGRVGKEGLILNEATIGVLRIHPIQDATCIYPAPLGLENLTVRDWKLGSSESANDRAKAGMFADLLKNDRERISRPTYLGIVKSMREHGEVNGAAQLVRAMEQRLWLRNLARPFQSLPGILGNAWPPGRGTLKAIWWPFGTLLSLLGGALTGLFYGLAIGFGTAPKRLGVMIGAIAVLASIFVYHDPANLELRVPATAMGSAPGAPQPLEQSSRFVSTDGSIRLADGTDPKCSPVQKITVMARNHVPTALNEEAATCRLSAQGQVRVGLSPRLSALGDLGGPWLWPLSPAEFGTWMRILSLILWPAFLAFLLKRAFRD